MAGSAWPAFSGSTRTPGGSIVLVSWPLVADGLWLNLSSPMASFWLTTLTAITFLMPLRLNSLSSAGCPFRWQC